MEKLRKADSKRGDSKKQDRLPSDQIVRAPLTQMHTTSLSDRRLVLTFGLEYLLICSAAWAPCPIADPVLPGFQAKLVDLGKRLQKKEENDGNGSSDPAAGACACHACRPCCLCLSCMLSGFHAHTASTPHDFAFGHSYPFRPTCTC